jgi:hypothetical protein
MVNYDNPSIKFANQSNQYYDLFTFLNDLLEGTSKMSIYDESNKYDQETKKFLDNIIPPHIRGLNNEKMIKNIIIGRPVDILYDKYFDEFKNKPSKNYSLETLFSHQYFTGKNINTFMDSDNYSILGKQDKIKSKYNIMNSNSRILKDSDIELNKINRKSKSSKILDDIDEEIVNKRFIKEEKKFEKVNRILVGGGDKIEYTPFRAEKNNPFLTNDQREVNKQRNFENPIKEPPVILEQKLYDTSQKPAPKSQFPPTQIPLYDETGSMINNILPYTHIRNQPPVQKAYTVNLAGPTSNLTSINRIYEDVLPGEQRTFSALTVYERKQLIDFLRNNMLDTIDGEEMTITGGRNSLLSHIKLMDVNPYTLKKNPYIDLARNFLLYRAAYPIRYDEKRKFIGIGKPSMGINIRIYMMSEGDLRCKTINNFINAENFDLWREIKYYDFIRDNIIKKKVSPNFIAPILYKIDSESKIKWDKLDIIKSHGNSNNVIKELVENQRLINEKHTIEASSNLFKFLIPNYFNNNNLLMTVNKKINNKIEKQTVPKLDLSSNSGKILILLTEAPTSNILQWSSTIYESYGSIKKMISTGYHSPAVWTSILFQLVYSLAVLEKNEMYIENFSLENNVYIKDISSDPNAVGSWIYKIDNIEYYVPNYGYILMIDSKFTDVEIDQSFIKQQSVSNQKFKIYGKIFNENSNFDIKNIKQKIFNQFKSVIDPDNFTHNFRAKGGSIPPDEIINLLTNMHNDKTQQTVKDFFIQYFGEFVHNRVGTLVSKAELEICNTQFSTPKVGSIMAHSYSHQNYRWVLVSKKIIVGSQPQFVIFWIENNVKKFMQVNSSSLKEYPLNEKLIFETKKNMRFDESYIYETYNFDN